MKKALVSLAALALTTGCLVENAYADMALNPDRFGVAANFTNVLGDGIRPVDARLAGDIGPAMRSVEAAAAINGFHDNGFTNLEVVVTNERGSAMAFFDIHGGVDHPAMRPGERLRFSGWDADAANNGLFISGIVCSGEGLYGEWNYDAPLSSVELQIEPTENPEVNRYHFTTIHDGDTATGHIDVVVPN